MKKLVLSFIIAAGSVYAQNAAVVRPEGATVRAYTAEDYAAEPANQTNVIVRNAELVTNEVAFLAIFNLYTNQFPGMTHSEGVRRVLGAPFWNQSTTNALHLQRQGTKLLGYAFTIRDLGGRLNDPHFGRSVVTNVGGSVQP